MNKRIFVVCAVAMTVSMMAGCKGIPTAEDILGSNTEVTESTEASSEETEAETESEDDKMALYNSYIDINNFMVGRVADVFDSYFKYVEFQEDFLPLQPDYWCLSMNDSHYKTLDATFEMASARTEKEKIDNDFITLYPVMKELMEAVDDVEEYTDMKSYLDDDYAKGKELHAIIWAKYNEYEPLANTYLDELEVVAAAFNEKELARFKEEGLEATYAINVLLNTAREMQDAIYEQNIYDDNIIELNIEALQPLYDEYVENVNTCLEYLDNEELMSEEGFPLHSAYYGTFESAVKESKVALTDMFQRVKDQKPIDSYQLNSHFAADGSIQNYDEKISAIINDYNHMINY